MQQRVERLRAKLAADNLDAMFVSQPENRRYLSGFTGSAGYLIISQKEAVLATDAHSVQGCSGLSAGYGWVNDRLGTERAEDLRARAGRVLSQLLGVPANTRLNLTVPLVTVRAWHVPRQSGPQVSRRPPRAR